MCVSIPSRASVARRPEIASQGSDALAKKRAHGLSTTSYGSHCQVSRSGQPAATQARSSSSRQNTARPIRTGWGTLPVASQARQVRKETLHSRAASAARSRRGNAALRFALGPAGWERHSGLSITFDPRKASGPRPSGGLYMPSGSGLSEFRGNCRRRRSPGDGTARREIPSGGTSAPFPSSLPATASDKTAHGLIRLLTAPDDVLGSGYVYMRTLSAADADFRGPHGLKPASKPLDQGEVSWPSILT